MSNLPAKIETPMLPQTIEQTKSLAMTLCKGIGVPENLKGRPESTFAIIMRGLELGVDYSLTHSCYNPAPGPCGACGACILRAAAFAEAGVPDPAMAGGRR